MFQIYNEQIYDLLDFDAQGMSAAENSSDYNDAFNKSLSASDSRQ